MANGLTRRQLALAALAATTAMADDTPDYVGPLTGFESKVNPAAFDSVAWVQKLYEDAPLRLTFRAKNKAQAIVWQNELRAKVTDLIGGFPAAKSPLNSQSLEVREYPNYRREKFVFESRPGLGVLAYLLTPKKAAAPLATVLCIPGHGRGVDDIVGIDDKGRDRTVKEGYQFDFAVQVAEQGMAALAIEPLGFGCRRDADARKHGLKQKACEPAAGSALLLGETMIAWRVYDVMRAIDWIESRRDLDAKRIGCMGISGGGTCTLFATALEPRIKAAMVSGYLNTFRDSVFSLPHCIDNYVPGLLKWAEMYDVAGLIAPRPLFAESGENDRIFPVASSKESFARVKKIYEIIGGPAEHDIHSGRHEFNGKKGIPFLKAQLV